MLPGGNLLFISEYEGKFSRAGAITIPGLQGQLDESGRLILE